MKLVTTELLSKRENICVQTVFFIWELLIDLTPLIKLMQGQSAVKNLWHFFTYMYAQLYLNKSMKLELGELQILHNDFIDDNEWGMILLMKKNMRYTDGMNDLDHDFSEVVCTVRILYLLRDSGSQE